MSNDVPILEPSTSLTCGYLNECGRAAVWHLSWYDPELPAGDWENSLSCQEHRDVAEKRGWTIGWRHRVSHACCMPGSLMHIAGEGDDEEGWPRTWCWHPFDAEAELVAAEHLEVTRV